MTEEERAVMEVEKPDAPQEWGSREEVQSMALRIQSTPLGKGFTQEECWGIAQYSRMMNLNPFRGEFYPMRGKDGKIHMVDGYKALVRWAKQEAPYVANYTNLPLEEGHLYHIRCHILRDDRRQMIPEYKAMGATFKEAYDLVAVYADGVITEKETISNRGNPIDPPKGWTWEQVTRKRALKNCLNLSHGAPSPREIAAASYLVNGTDTTLEDWEGTEKLKYPEERERLALMRAQERQRRGEWESMTKEEHQTKLRENVDMMRAPADFEGFGDEPEQPKMAGGFSHVPREAKPAKKPPPGTEEEPASEKRAKIETTKWNEAATELVAEIGYYTNKDGSPNWSHLTAAAYIMGYPQVTDDNLGDVIDGLGLYAEDQQAVAAENEGSSEAEGPVQKGLDL